jgi:hypothetical protein
MHNFIYSNLLQKISSPINSGSMHIPSLAPCFNTVIETLVVVCENSFQTTGRQFVWACAQKINMATYIRSVSWIYLVLKLIKQHFNERKLCNIKWKTLSYAFQRFYSENKYFCFSLLLFMLWKQASSFFCKNLI